MAKKPQLHPYADLLSFERILLLIATIIHYPGIGNSEQNWTDLSSNNNQSDRINKVNNSHENLSYKLDIKRYNSDLKPSQIPTKKGSLKTDKHHNALAPLQAAMRKFAQSIGIQFPDNYPAIATIRKDLETLREFGILDRRMYRWGYYLGTGVMSREDLKVAFNALQNHALYQGDPRIRQIYQTLKQRLRGLDLETNGDFFYPIRAYLNRPIIYTDPDEMMAKGNNRHTLFHCIEIVENAIATGQLVELYRQSEPYRQRTGYLRVYPLQLFYHDIGWYLLYEESRTLGLYESEAIQHLEVERVDRLKDYCQIIEPNGRGQNTQLESLKLAQKLINSGWGIYLGTPEHQYQERCKQLSLESIKVRFFPPSATFILEGESRHKSQQIIKGIKDENGNYQYIDYKVKLPRRSFPEFSRWVYRHMGNAQVLSPPDLVEMHRQAAESVAARYSH
ncbi:helix-turn-helix transcriptional regulator [Limnofasciculus baicalensis]|uniref:WYL domain-containing protein n=1 Tax=Limnofasciculus baicalensis BBK-W-15 TaxID=2699891 RepID=A0AAE3GTK7_9CYAN|nr:WYL domain-containing protein [Limnofasciculus baicalensis]MCP2729777.1 WYL domain-containing protein [Limnofasciculus baicalensis BBK-W-15]